MSHSEGFGASLGARVSAGLKALWRFARASWSLHRRKAETNRALSTAVHRREVTLCLLGRQVRTSLEQWPSAPEKLMAFEQTFQGLKGESARLKAEIQPTRGAIAALRTRHLAAMSMVRDEGRMPQGPPRNLGSEADFHPFTVHREEEKRDRETRADPHETRRAELRVLRRQQAAELEGIRDVLDQLITRHVRTRIRMESILVEMGAEALKAQALPVPEGMRNAALAACENVETLRSDRAEMVGDQASLAFPDGVLRPMAITTGVLVLLLCLALWLK